MINSECDKFLASTVCGLSLRSTSWLYLSIWGKAHRAQVGCWLCAQRSLGSKEIAQEQQGRLTFKLRYCSAKNVRSFIRKSHLGPCGSGGFFISYAYSLRRFGEIEIRPILAEKQGGKRLMSQVIVTLCQTFVTNGGETINPSSKHHQSDTQ